MMQGEHKFDSWS